MEAQHTDIVDLTATEDAQQNAAAQQQQPQTDGNLAAAMREAAAGVLLPFQRALLQEMLEEDGLCVLSPGMGLHQVVAVLLRLQDVRLRRHGQSGCVLVLGASGWQRDALRRELLRIDPVIRAKAEAALDAAMARGSGGGGARAAAAFEVPAEVTADVAAAERAALYASRPCLFVTTRILVVDQLSGRIAAEQIAGIIVLNAHRVTDSSGEGFAVRLFKNAVPQGVVRAFSDWPASFASEFNKVEKVMKALHVRRLYLWPRFQEQARQDLEARPPQLVELCQPMTGAMALIYESITELMDACVKELRKTNKLDTSDLTVEQGLFRSFDDAVRRQLSSIWHTVSPKTKQIVTDLRTLRSLGSYMLRFDAVTFMSYLDNLRATEGTKSVWLFHPAAHTIFEAAKSRVYRLRQSGGTASAAAASAQRKRKQPAAAAGESESGGGRGAAPVIEAVLESMPKWDLLREVMAEIQEARKAARQLAGAAAAADGGGGDGQADAQQQQQPEQQQGQQQQQQQQVPDSSSGGGGRAAGLDSVGEAGASGQQQQAAPPKAATAASAEALRQAAAAPVLVACQDSFTARQLREVLKSGGTAALMQRLYRDYLQYKLDGGTVGRRRAAAAAGQSGGSGPGQQQQQPPSGMGPGGGELPPTARMMGGYRAGEEVALLREAKALAGPAAVATAAAAAAASGKGGRGRSGGRSGGRGRGGGRSGGGGGRGGRKGGKAEDAAAAAAALAVASTAGRGHRESPPLQQLLPPSPGSADGEGEGMQLEGSPLPVFEGVGGKLKVEQQQDQQQDQQKQQQDQQQGGQQAPLHPLLEGVQIVALDACDVLRLWDVRPAYVVMYDPDVSFIRQLEMYKAGRPGLPLCVYLLRYEDSFEMDRYQAALARERQVFESLIRNKEIMILPIAAARDQVDPARRLPASHRAEDVAAMGGATNALTRRGGGRSSGKAQPKRVVVDVREFMSSLPAVLHQQGLEVVPLTLEVGDYVLSPDVCCERKSISDLRQSLASGRLYHQAEAMTKHYKTPVLLIEFEGDKAFALQASSELGDDVQLHSLMGRIALLVLHFPRLRLIWSRSLHATADMFQQLKGNQEEPDPVAAATVGVPLEGEGAAGAAEAVVNQAAIDLLRRLPGVSEASWRPLMREVDSLAELGAVPLDRLAAVMGGQAAAKKLHEFLTQDCQALFAAL